MSEHSVLVILDSDVLKARRLARELARELHFDEAAATEIEIAVAELAANHLKHRTVRGRMILRAVQEEGRAGVEIVSEDEGPGIPDVERAMRESTAGTLGIGLSAVRRLTDEFSLESSPSGTRVVARKWQSGRLPEHMQFSVFSRPMPGETVNGDAYFIKQMPYHLLFGVVDGLGHGPQAFAAADQALKIVEEEYRGSLHRLVEACHAGLRATRGAAMSACRVDLKAGVLEHVGIGNVETRIYGRGEVLRPFCFNGTLGMRMETWKVLTYPYRKGTTVVMFSDGVSGRFELAGDELERSPQEIARRIFNHARSSDDATVLVGR